MRILYDTNVLVTILSRREAILQFKKHVTEEGIMHVSSPHVLGEVEAVLVERLSLTRHKAKAAVRLLSRVSQIVEPTSIERICRDPYDDYILAAAIAGKVDYIVTADNDLLILKGHRGIRIVTPTELTQMLPNRSVV